MTLETLKNRMEEIESKINWLSCETGYELYDSMNIAIDQNDKDAVYLVKQYGRIMDQLWKASETMRKLRAPIVAAGTLHKGASGRYQVDGHELTSGDLFEALIHGNEYEGQSYWKEYVMEYDHKAKDYRAYYDLEEPLEGLTVRIRGRL